MRNSGMTITDTLSSEQLPAVMALWNAEYPEGIGYETAEGFACYLRALTRPHHYLAYNEGRLLTWAFAFTRDGERWFAVIVTEGSKGQGTGSRLLQRLKADNDELSGWVIDGSHYRRADGQPYLSPLSFYLKNGFSVLSDTRLETDQLSAVKIRWRK